MYTSQITVDGREHFTRQYVKWMDAFMDAVDASETYRRRSFCKPGPEVSITIKYTFTNTVAATYSHDDGWDFR